jgi:hypothetical protein
MEFWKEKKIQNQDWVAQTSIKFKSQLNLNGKLIPRSSSKFKCQLSINYVSPSNEGRHIVLV